MEIREALQGKAVLFLCPVKKPALDIILFFLQQFIFTYYYPQVNKKPGRVLTTAFSPPVHKQDHNSQLHDWVYICCSVLTNSQSELLLLELDG